MAYGHGNPAMNAAIGNAPGMMLIAGGVAGMANGLFRALDGIAEAVHQRAYVDALQSATNHASEMEALAREAVQMIADLEAEVSSLRAACRQRQDVINALVGRA